MHQQLETRSGGDGAAGNTSFDATLLVRSLRSSISFHERAMRQHLAASAGVFSSGDTSFDATLLVRSLRFPLSIHEGSFHLVAAPSMLHSWYSHPFEDTLEPVLPRSSAQGGLM